MMDPPLSTSSSPPSSSFDSHISRRLTSVEVEATKYKIISLLSNWRVAQNVAVTPEDEAVTQSVKEKRRWISRRNMLIGAPLAILLTKRFVPTQNRFPLSFTINRAIHRMRFGFNPPDRILYQLVVCVVLLNIHSAQVRRVVVDQQLESLSQLHSPLGRETRYLLNKYIGENSPLLKGKGEFEWEDNEHVEEYKGKHADEIDLRPVWNRQQQQIQQQQHQQHQPLYPQHRFDKTRDVEDIDDYESSGGILSSMSGGSAESDRANEKEYARRRAVRGVRDRRVGWNPDEHETTDSAEELYDR